MNSSHQNKNDRSQQESRPAMVHSTHANMETFDQATRDQETAANSGARSSSSTTDMSTLSGSSHKNQLQDQKRQLQKANSGVQLDRDVQQSRSAASDSAKPASAGRSTSWKENDATEYPYIE
ncbi:hypothetical protein BGZ83_000479 [Gryganskiella cystojenkinii]|nr:hypothetical protein BGZ83_000479 [Gryganskiella cystojenkinii]